MEYETRAPQPVVEVIGPAGRIKINTSDLNAYKALGYKEATAEDVVEETVAEETPAEE